MLDDYDNLLGGSIVAPYGRLGGKSRLKKIVVEQFPKDYENMIYVEPFFGAGSIFYHKEPSVKEVINDLDKNIFILMKGFKKYDGYQISKDINGLHSRAFFNKLRDFNPRNDYSKFIRVLLLTRLSFFNNMTSYDGSSGVNDGLISSDFKDKFNVRLKNTTILNKDYKDVIKKYDSKNTLFYLDPPYSMSEGAKYYDGQSISITELYDTVKNIKGKFLISYDDDKATKELFKKFKIIKVNTIYQHTANIAQRPITEILISNY